MLKLYISDHNKGLPAQPCKLVATVRGYNAWLEESLFWFSKAISILQLMSLHAHVLFSSKGSREPWRNIYQYPTHQFRVTNTWQQVSITFLFILPKSSSACRHGTVLYFSSKSLTPILWLTIISFFLSLYWQGWSFIIRQQGNFFALCGQFWQMGGTSTACKSHGVVISHSW